MKANTRTAGGLGLAAAALVLALSGCGNPGMPGSGTTAAPTLTEEFPSAPAVTTEPTPSASGTPAAAPAEILIKGFKYQGTDTVSPGAEITVTNDDVEAHTITADTGNAFDTITKVGTTTFTAPTEPGTYPYHCIFHGNMKGTLTVK
ncbi:cupredoxin domain-containing protein [Arthrobacter sp. Z4-13]